MHMSLSLAAKSIFKGDLNILTQNLWKRVNPSRWPISIKELPPGTALVGGAIRDGLLEKYHKKQDLDLVVPNRAIDLTKSLAKKVGGKFVLLDASRDIARLIVDTWTIDIASQIGGNLDEDLLRRDYTVNAMALELNKTSLIKDPTGGLNDLAKKRLVAVNEKNLTDDPLRLIRGLRIMAELNFSIDSKTKSWIKKHNQLLKETAPERIQYEIERLVNAEWADKAITLITQIQLLEAWQENTQNYLLPKQNIGLNDLEIQVALPLLRLTYLLSQKGLAQLRFSKRQQERCQKLRYWQDRNNGNGFRDLEEKELLKLHQELEQDLPALILELSPSDQNTWLKRWRNPEDRLFHPRAPINGNTLQISLGLPSGPLLGDLLNYLCLENAFGRIKNQEEALHAARNWWEHKQTLL